MKRRILKTITVLLLMIVAIAGFMPYTSKEVQAETKTKQIVFDKDTIDGIHVYLGENFSKDGITLECEYEKYVLEEGFTNIVDLHSGYLIVSYGSFVFSSSIGKISKIEIECGSAPNVPSGWTVSGDYSDLTVTWQGDPSYTVMINNESESILGETQIKEISEIVFTVITEDVTGITLDETSLEMKPGDTKTLTATLSPSTATEKEVKWSSSNTSVATVSDNGLVTAVAEGEAVITASATNGTETTTDDKSTSCKVTVKIPIIEYRLWIGGNRVTSEYLSNTDEGWSYDPETNVLTLSDADITGTYRNMCIYSTTKDLTISLSGKNKVGSKDAYYGIYVDSDSVITGEGSLTISDVDAGIITAWSSIKIKDTTVKISECVDGVAGVGAIEIDNSTVNVSVSENGMGIMLDVVKITDSKVDITAGYCGIYSLGFSISGDSYVSSDTVDKYAMTAERAFDIADLDIIEPEEGGITNAVIEGFDQDPYYFVSDKDGNIVPKAIIAKTYTIKFVNDDGTELQSSKVITGEMPKYEGDTPTKPSDGKYEYTFKGWDKKITEAKADATYTAVFESKEISTPQPDPKPVTPFPVPNTGIEAPESFASIRYIALLGICAFAASFLNKKH